MSEPRTVGGSPDVPVPGPRSPRQLGRSGVSRRHRWRNGRRPEVSTDEERALHEPRMCIPCVGCGEHLLIAESAHVVREGGEEDEARRRLRAALELGTRKLRCNRCSGFGGCDTRDGVDSTLTGPFRPIEYRLHEGRKQR